MLDTLFSLYLCPSLRQNHSKIIVINLMGIFTLLLFKYSGLIFLSKPHRFLLKMP
jgi:hypothetical protein